MSFPNIFVSSMCGYKIKNFISYLLLALSGDVREKDMLMARLAELGASEFKFKTAMKLVA